MWHHHATRLVLLYALIQCLVNTASAAPATAVNNTTKANGTSDNQLYCEKTTWYDICWFFFTNYLLHALSVRSLPGENQYSSTVFKLCCLLVPYTGVRRGLSLISRASSLTRDDLQAAARAGALCMVVRKPDWRPEDGQTVHGCQLKDVEGVSSEEIHTSIDRKTASDDTSEIEKLGSRASTLVEKCANQGEVNLNIRDPDQPPAPSGLLEKLSLALILTDRFLNDKPSSSPVDHESSKIHGLCKLAPGYGLSYLSPNVQVYARNYPQIEGDRNQTTRIASTHDIPRILFSMIQTISAGYSLYKARGSQIDRYGFAAFGLTVLPYMIVSIINFIGSLLSAEYETIYMVQSTTMEEMVARGGVVDGVVGSLHKDPALASAPPTPQMCSDGEARSINFEGVDDQLSGHEAGIEKGHSFTILPYELPEILPSKNWIIRFCHRYRRWHGLATGPKGKSKTLTSGPTIEIPSHSPIDYLPPPVSQDYLNILAMVILFLTLALPYAVIAFLTGWKANLSTNVQRNFTLTWLICGQVQGYAVSKVERLTGKKSSIRGLILIFLFYGSNCLAGLTIVAQEMLEFGTCKAM